MHKLKMLIGIMCIIISPKLFAQGSNTDSANMHTGYLKIFIDGVPDWQDYVKVKLWYADYVRDPRLAQVQVIVSLQPTASGGALYHIFFLGRDKFSGKNDTLTYTAPEENTKRQTRDGVVTVIDMGLMPYFALNGQQKYFSFTYNDIQEKIKKSGDKWNYWVFTLQANPDLTVDASGTAVSGFTSVSAARVTPQKKFRLLGDIVLDYNNFKTDSINYASTELIEHLNGLWVKSINDHWSWGLEAGAYSSTFSNIQSEFSFAPGVEYDLFPYSESVNHILTLKYRIKPAYTSYTDTSIYNYLHEVLLNHILDATYTRIERWGNISTTVTATQFLNHPSQFRLDLTGQMDFHIAQGLFLNLGGHFAYIKNQRSISNVGLSAEEIILQHKETLSNFNYGLSVGITYTFGAIFNSIVNPRYESGITIDPEVASIIGP